jgi:16S rRNA (cytidine1402-2'-O)-methyltransferase
MSNKGTLFLIPNIIAENTQDKIIAPQLKVILPGITHFLVESIRTARRYLSSLKVYNSIEEIKFAVLDKDTPVASLAELMAPLNDGFNVGIISESGCPGIADPGAIAVKYAHEHDIRVIPLVGPSSILMALMASGLNGQKFAFNGYLPIDGKEISASIKAYEKESRNKSQTQIFIETPYRNNAVFQALLSNLSQSTLLTIAVDLTGSAEQVLTKTVRHWKTGTLALPKTPAVFLFLA